MLQDAALLQLDVLLAALADGFVLKDGTPYNVQFVGSRPTFIDIASITRLVPGDRHGKAIGSSASSACTRCCFRPTRTSTSTRGCAAASTAFRPSKSAPSSASGISGERACSRTWSCRRR